ncbi:MAG: Na(+)/H(+) antiporter subunit D, partial [Deltaproteobacteria bacterium]
MISAVPPAFIFIIGGLLLPLLGARRLKQVWLLFVPALAFADLLVLPNSGTSWTYHFLGYNLVFGKIDTLSLCFGYVFCIMAFLGMVYALHVKEEGQHLAAMFYIGSALGVTFAGDLFTLFIF